MVIKYGVEHNYTVLYLSFFFFKQKTAYEMRISDWSSDVCSSDLSVASIIAATLFGTILGIARLSKNWLVSRVASAYIETMRNIPLLLQLFFWYAIITEVMPGPREALHPIDRKSVV